MTTVARETLYVTVRVASGPGSTAADREVA